MGLAGVARGESLPGGDRCLEKGIHLGTRTRFLFHALCTTAYTYIHTHTHAYITRIHATSHYSLSAITYISGGGGSWSNIHSAHLHRKRNGKRERERVFPVFRAYASISSVRLPSIPFFAILLRRMDCVHPSDLSFEAFRGFVLLVCTRGRDYLYALVSRSIYLALQGTSWNC